jgi:hypothetical protein
MTEDTTPKFYRVYCLNLDPSGYVKGWSQSDVDTEVDAEAMLSIPGRVRVNKSVIDQYQSGGTWGWTGETLEPRALPIDLAREKAAALWQADQFAEAERRPFLSAGAGQAMEYMMTLEEARACLSTTSPQPIHYPLLSAELEALTYIGQTTTLIDVATNIINLDGLVRAKMRDIKFTRRVRKLRVRAASTADELATALAFSTKTTGA